MKKLFIKSKITNQKGTFKSMVAGVFSFLLMMGSIQAMPDLTVRFANPEYDCINNIYCVDVEFTSNEPQRRLAGMNIRFVYDSYVLQFHSIGQFSTGYALLGTPNINTGSQTGGPGFFGFNGPLTYFNGAMQLSNPYASPVYLPTGGWTKLYRLCFTVVDEDAFHDNAFSPSIVWEKQEDPANGGFFGGSAGVVMTLVDPDNPLLSNPATTNVVQFNWAYNQDGGISWGHPVVTDVFSLPPSDCSDLDMVVNISEMPFLLEGATPDGGFFSGNGVSGNVFHPSTAGVGIHQIRYEYMNEDTGCPMICFFDIVVYDIPRVSGQVTYFNDAQTPLNDVVLTLKDNAGIVAAVTTSGDYFVDPGDINTLIQGYFSFPYLPDGDYTITASTSLPWYEANATDALVVQLHIVGDLPEHIVWDPVLSYEAADVNLSNTITSLDALHIIRRNLQLINNFPAGDWIFDKPSFTVSGPTQVNIRALNTGDVNRSNIPGQTKSEITLLLQNRGEILVQKDDIIYLPIAVKDPAEFGAITLDLKYRSDLIKILETDFELENINHSNGSLTLAWSSEISRSYQAGEPLTTFRIKILGHIPPGTRLFEAGVRSELADAKARVLKNTVLEIPSLVYEGPQEKELLLSNQPNPFNEFTLITYTLPEAGNVILVVYDHAGRVVEKLVDTYQQAGFYEVEFRHAGLVPGVYPYRIILDQGEKASSESQTMIYISKD